MPIFSSKRQDSQVQAETYEKEGYAHRATLEDYAVYWPQISRTLEAEAATP